MTGLTLKHYEVGELLGQGGMGMVYRARDVRLDRAVALKVLKPDLTSDPDRKRRFLQEARSASKVTHPAIAQIYDVDEVDGTLFIAMEFVEGKTARRLVEDRELDLLGAVEIAIQASEGLARAHDAGIVHRDIKSDNIMVTGDGHAKLLDFGLAKLLDTGQTSSGGTPIAEMETVAQTQIGMVLGTVAYMSPEQARGRPVDKTSDVFSMGVVVYELVTGELPFKGQSPLDTMHAIAFEEVRPVTVVRKHLPPNLHRIVARCLRKRSADRYADAGKLAEELKALKRDIDSGVRRSISPGDRAREWLVWIQDSMPHGWAGIAVAVAAIALVVYLVFTQVDIGSLVALGLIGLIVYRVIRNRRRRMMQRFVSKAKKLNEVRAIRIRENEIVVVVDEAKAKTYIRVNSLTDTINSKLFSGDPVEASVRDDLSPEALESFLREPGIAYVRDD